MKATNDIQPLIEVAEEQFTRLYNEAETALNALTWFWTKLYGPNEAAMPAFDALSAMWETFHEVEEVTA